MKRFFLLISLTALLLLGLAAAAVALPSDGGALTDASAPAVAAEWTNPFSDVQAGAWYYAALADVCQSELMLGRSATEFAPEAALTRAMAATVFYRAAGEPKVAEQAEFADLQAGDSCFQAAAWAVSEGIIAACENGSFQAADTVSREQLAKMLFSYQKIEVVTMEYNLGRFIDEHNVSAFAQTALNYYVGRGVFNGYNDNSLRPQSLLTRAEFAAVMHRCFN